LTFVALLAFAKVEALPAAERRKWHAVVEVSGTRERPQETWKLVVLVSALPVGAVTSHMCVYLAYISHECACAVMTILYTDIHAFFLL
jgi:hypothetical protein